MKTLNVALIGCGAISSMHIDSSLGLPLSRLVCVCDIKEERARKIADKYQLTYYTDYKEMIEKENLDAVHICLPHYLHTEVSAYALKHGINVLCEKPMSIAYKDAEDTVLLAEALNLKYGIIFQCRYNTPAVYVKKHIESGKIGRVKCARLTLTWSRSDDYYSKSDWKGTWDKEGGGVVIDQAIHSLDLANWFIDSEVVDIKSSLYNRNHKTMIVEDTAEGFIRYKNGVSLSFWAMNNYEIDEPIEIRLHCENADVRLSYDDAVIEYRDGSREHIKNEPQTEIKYTGGKSYWGNQHAVQINNFYQSILGAAPLEVSGREALKIQEIICAIYKNNRGNTVCIPENLPQGGVLGEK